ncbi:hypothetical protein [Streptococcus pyogenes]|uniref:hypothetical protein n=1 Tax=Streptococcus pyogenes TaxID=1314 RepID=UPI0010DB96E3|nr:hypothetical protein [Streptococcus pyogenes]VHD83324.1 Uncharacterised protein [Streptococcus pyogenes NS88.2]
MVKEVKACRRYGLFGYLGYHIAVITPFNLRLDMASCQICNDRYAYLRRTRLVC